MTESTLRSMVGPAPPDGEAALSRRIAGLRRRSDHLSTLLFCLVCCLDVIADGLVEHGQAEHEQTGEARALLARIDQVKAKAASARQCLHDTERLLHGSGVPGDVAWHA